MLSFTSGHLEEMLSCFYSRKLIDKLSLMNAILSKRGEKLIDLLEVERGICYAKYYHADQMRESGEPYYSHPLEVAYMVTDYLPRTDVIITAILHDTLEDTAFSREEIIEVFGKKIAAQVYDLTRIKENGVKISSAQMIEELWIQKKYDVLLIKLFDRINNMQTISVKSPSKANKILSETLSYFIILAAEFGLLEVEKFLDDICYKNKHRIRNIQKLTTSDQTTLHAYGNLSDYADLDISKK
jgi:(p)ppGpp synthase/HD superfamily hydrolase